MQKLQIGKIPESLLKSLIFGNLPKNRPEIVLGSAVGEDCAALVLKEDEMLVMSTDPITGASIDSGRLAVTVTVNDLASSGAETIGLLVTVLMPPSSTKEELEIIVKDLCETCSDMGISLIGGHTEVTDAVTRPVISVTGAGKVKKDSFISTGGAKPGMDIIMTKWAGLEGTSIIAKEREKELLQRFPAHMIEAGKSLDKYLSVAKDGIIAAGEGAKAMHDITEGGILGALWEMAEASGAGLEVDMARIPVRQETVEICEYFDLNPYRLISSGSMLIAAEDGEKIQKALVEEGISSAIIGRFTEGNDRVVFYDDRKRFLTPPETDELYKVV